jgi:iron complex transport system substrate-binding protein
MTKTIERTRALSPLPEIDDATRREFLIGAAGLLLLPAACGGSGQDAGGDRSGQTRTIEHALGTTQVPAEPRRVFVSHGVVVDTALALGVEPVGAFNFGTRGNFLDDRLPDDAEVLGGPTPNLEAIAALEPDLILDIDLNVEETYDELSRIAPTVAVPFDSTGAWQRIGRAVGRSWGS